MYDGIIPPELAAGFAGGMVNAFLFPKPTPWKIVGSIMIGGATAYYISIPVSMMTSWPMTAVAFAIGVAGRNICEKFITVVKSWVSNDRV